MTASILSVNPPTTSTTGAAWPPTGGIEAEDGWYFFGGSGAMKSAQWLEWKGNWYYLTESGKMAADTTVGGYYVNADGVWVE